MASVTSVARGELFQAAQTPFESRLNRRVCPGDAFDARFLPVAGYAPFCGPLRPRAPFLAPSRIPSMTIRVLQCFAAGIHTSTNRQTREYTERDLSFMAAAYDRDKHSAALVLGHPDNDQPSYGNVRGVIAEGPSLFCVAEVGDALMGLVTTGSYKNVSASFWPPGDAANPVPSAYYLKHVGFLGARLPAVKGMQPIAFAVSPTFGDTHSFDFAAPGNSQVDDARMQLHRAALELHHSSPGLTYRAAAERVERALYR